MDRFNSAYNTSIRLRIGISTGPVVAGVIGRRKFTFDLWGDTVNLACHFGAYGEGGSIAVAEGTYERLKESFQFPRKRVLDIKGQPAVTAYELGSRL